MYSSSLCFVRILGNPVCSVETLVPKLCLGTAYPGLPWFPNSVWEPLRNRSQRNSVWKMLESAAKQSFASNVPKQSLGTRRVAERFLQSKSWLGGRDSLEEGLRLLANVGIFALQEFSQ